MGNAQCLGYFVGTGMLFVCTGEQLFFKGGNSRIEIGFCGDNNGCVFCRLLGFCGVVQRRDIFR